jgi:hypothetical protein
VIRPTVVFGLAQRRRASPTFEDDDEDEDEIESLQLCLIRIPEDPGEKELAGVVIDDGE